MTKVVILGAAGNCVDIVDAIQASNAAGRPPVDIMGFLDDAPGAVGLEIAGVRVLGPVAMARELKEARLVCGIGSSKSYRLKQMIVAATGRAPEDFHTVVHPTAAIASTATVGEGAVLLAHTSVGSRAVIGRHVMMLPNCVVGHDSTIGDYSIFAAGVVISGNVDIQQSCYLGARSTVRDGVRIGSGALVGLGSAVIADVEAGLTVAGVPARPLRAP